METDKILNIILDNLNENLVKVIFTTSKSNITKIVMRQIAIKNQLMYQAEEFIDNKAHHKNLAESEIQGYIKDCILLQFKNVNIITTEKSISIKLSKKGKALISSSAINRDKVSLSHNKEKNYLLNEGEDLPIMRELGLFTADNKIVKSKFDKFRQINQFIKNVNENFKNYKKDSITILDFGCGKSYLTFLLYHYMVKIKGLQVKIIGYDLKVDVVEKCNDLAVQYGYSGMKFIVGDVNRVKIDYNVDMMITLHACDTATDCALNLAIKNDIDYIFSVPCCQHEINANIKSNDMFSVILQHGILKERFSSIITDSIRCELLKQCGYSVDIVEFIESEHTPKNLMIRAKRQSTAKRDFGKVENLLNYFNCNQSLYEQLNK